MGKDVCPRLRGASAHKLYVPPAMTVPEGLRNAITKNRAHLERVEPVWDEWGRMAASTHLGKASAVDILSRFGSAAAGVQIGRLLLTLYPCSRYRTSAGKSCVRSTTGNGCMYWSMRWKRARCHAIR